MLLMGVPLPALPAWTAAGEGRGGMEEGLPPTGGQSRTCKWGELRGRGLLEPEGPPHRRGPSELPSVPGVSLGPLQPRGSCRRPLRGDSPLWGARAPAWGGVASGGCLPRRCHLVLPPRLAFALQPCSWTSLPRAWARGATCRCPGPPPGPPLRGGLLRRRPPPSRPLVQQASAEHRQSLGKQEPCSEESPPCCWGSRTRPKPNSRPGGRGRGGGEAGGAELG